MSDFESIWGEVEEALADDFPLTAVHELELELTPAHVEPLLDMFAHDDLRAAFAGGLLLARIDAAEVIAPLIVPFLNDPHPLIADHTRWILRELGAPALAPLMDAYASRPAYQHAIATALAFQGPRAAAASVVLVDDARRDPAIADALREIVGPWPAAPVRPLPYLGESIRLDLEGPPPREYHELELWLDIVQWPGSMDEMWWVRAISPLERIDLWRPDQIAIAAPQIVVAAYNADDRDVVTTTLHADDGARFTRGELLWKLRDAHHRIAPCNDRIYEGLKRQDDGTYYISTGS